MEQGGTGLCSWGLADLGGGGLTGGGRCGLGERAAGCAAERCGSAARSCKLELSCQLVLHEENGLLEIFLSKDV